MNLRIAPILTALLFATAVPATVASAREQPADAPSDIRPVLVGTEVPDVPLTTSDGAATSLHAALGDGPAILVFYRGGW